MTFCLGITVEQGLVGIADTRLLSGNECLVGRKTATYQGPGFSFFVMHSGLRSARDKILLYFEEAFECIDSAQKVNGVCLVHCNAGISRSVSLCVGYIMARMGLSYEDGLKKARNVDVYYVVTYFCLFFETKLYNLSNFLYFLQKKPNYN